MDITLKEFVQILFTVFAGGLASYVAIRMDLAVQKSRLTNVEEGVKTAHKRIDSVILGRRQDD